MTKRILFATAALTAVLVAFLGLRGHFSSTPAQASDEVQATSGAAPGDRPVTLEAYKAGFATMTECLAKVGWVPERPSRLTSRNVYDFQFYIPNANPNASVSERSTWENGLRDCFHAFDPVQRVWEIKMSMSAEERQQARDYLAACMREKGVQIAAHPSEADLTPFVRITPDTDRAAHKVLQLCQVATEKEFDLRNGELP